MKRTARCPKCSSTRIGHFDTVRDADRHGEQTRKLAYEAELEGNLFTGTLHHHMAEVEAWVCTRCGFFEEYVKDPGLVPWDKLSSFTFVE